jgi:hypothetical protein
MTQASKIGKIAENVRLDVLGSGVLSAEFCFREGSLHFYTTPTTMT